MPETFEIKEIHTPFMPEWKIRDPKSGYTLVVGDDRKAEEYRVNFQYPAKGGPIMVTGRDIDDYKIIGQLPKEPGKKFLEIGPGLGGCAEYILNPASGCQPQLPIVLNDMADYELMEQMLRQAEKLKVHQSSLERIMVFRRRIDLILRNPDKIQLINKPVEELLNDERFAGKMDVVIANYVFLYLQPVYWNEPIGKRFLKERGILLDETTRKYS